MTQDQTKPGYVCAWAFHPGHWICGNPSCGPCAARGQGFQGGLSNAKLLAAFKSKLPNVEPTDRDLSIFALGIEVGDRRQAVQKLMAKLADLLDEDQFAHCENIVRAAGVEPFPDGVTVPGQQMVSPADAPAQTRVEK